MNQFKIRASSVPRILACPASLRLGGFNHSTGEATLGTAAHYASRKIVEGDNVADAVKAALNVYTVDAKQLERLAWGAWQIWQAYQIYFPNAECEVTLPLLELARDDCAAETSGHCDVLSLMPLESGKVNVHVFDWKSDIAGRGEGDHWPQLRTYACLAWQGIETLSDGRYTLDDVESVWAGVGYLGSREGDGRMFTTDELDAFMDSLETAINDSPFVPPTPCEHCRYCPALIQCPATKAAITAFSDGDQQLITAYQVESTLYSLKAIEAVTERVKGTLRAVLHQGPMALEDGRVVCLLPRIDEKLVTSPDLLGKIAVDFSPDELCEAITVSKTALTDAVKARTEKDKGKAAEAYIAELRGNGCFEHKLVETISVISQDKLDAAVEKMVAKQGETI